MSIELIALVLALMAIAVVFIPTLVTGSSPVPTSKSVRDTIFRVLPDRLPGSNAGAIYDLGSGWGGMAIALALKYPNHQVVGYEISPLPWLISRCRLMFIGQKNLKIVWADYRRKKLSDATLVLCYLLPEPMSQLKGKLETDLAPGSLVISNTFAFRGWRPLDDKVADDIYNSHVYLYEIGTTDEISPT